MRERPKGGHLWSAIRLHHIIKSRNDLTERRSIGTVLMPTLREELPKGGGPTGLDLRSFTAINHLWIIINIIQNIQN